MEIKKYTLAIVLSLVSFTLWATPVCTVYVPSTTNGQRCGAGDVTLTAVSSDHGPAIIAQSQSMSASPQFGPPGGGTTYTTRWYYASSGGSYFATGTSQTFNLSTTTTYYVSTYSSAGCESARIPIIATISFISTASAGSNQNICTLGGGVILAANSPTYGTGAWSVSSGPSTLSSQFSSTSNPAATFTAAGGAGVYSLTWTITSSGCSPSSSSMSLTLNQAPTTSNAGADQTGGSTCGQTSVTLAANSPTVGTGTWSIAIDSPVPPGYTFGGLHNPGLHDPHTIFNGTPGVGYNLVWTITNGTCSSSDETVVMFNQAPTSSNAGSNQSICSDTPSISLSANTPSAGTGSWTVTSGPSLAASQFSSVSSPSATFTPVGGTGLYGLSWVISSPAGSSCPASSSSVNIAVNLKPVITTTDNHVTMNKAVRLKTEPGATYDWRNGSNVQVSTRDSLATRVIDTYTVTVVRPGIGGACTSNPFAVVKQTDGMNLNYIISTAVTVKGITNAADVPNLSVDSASQTIQYFDGIGRPIQTVTTQGSPLKKDNVQPIVYDPYGREVTKYLPYVASSYNGRMKTDFLPAENSGYNTNPQYLFYQNTPKVSTDTKPYANTTFETDPRNRPAKDYSAGAAWSNKPVRHAYLLNQHGTSANQEKIIAWTINVSHLPVHAAVLTGYIETNGFYSTGQLDIKQSKDEHGNAVREYTDKEGHVILKKVQAIAGDSSDLTSNSGWALTYYVYDSVGNLRFVLPPELSRRAHSPDTYSITKTDLKNWAFQYTYDARNRMITKQVPGSGIVYMVYDNRDRIVMTQDSIQRVVKQWLFTKYDALNRSVMTGIYTDSVEISQSVMSARINTSVFAEKYDPAKAHGYTTDIFPKTNLTVHTITFYDNYTFRNDLAGSNYNFVNNHLTGQETVYFDRLRGQVTGSKINILGTSDYLWSVNYFDDQLRVIQSVAQNAQAGVDRTTSILDFAGKVMETRTTHATASATHAVKRRLQYDHAGRLLRTYHKMDSEPEVLLTGNQYNELGQLADKNLYSTNNGSTFKQSVDYRYNIRGWLTSINNSQLTNNGTNNDDTNDLFGMELGYNNSLGTGNSQMYNGNISGMKWSSNLALGTVKDVAYNYSYDPMNRIFGATYRKDTIGGWSNSLNSFSESGYTYDLNGNIKRLRRNGSLGVLMDSLSYNYGTGSTSSNRLLKVGDAGNKTKGFIEPGSTSGDDYTYDPNGNMISDKNKAITAITYNHLNLPVQVTKSSNEYIKYIYDAGGRKLRQEVYNASNVLQKKTNYEGDFFYENDTLKFINHEEGRIVMTGVAPEYQYHLKDHLGNVRTTFTTKDEIETSTATLESSNYVAEYGQFISLDLARRINARIFDHTHKTSTGTGTTSVRLSGAENEKIGLAKSLSVMPGDKIDIEVFGKYVSGSGNNQSLIDALAAIAGTVGGSVTGAVIDGAGYTTASTAVYPFIGLGRAGTEDTGGPKAYLNYYLFDRDFNPITGGFKRLSSNAKETGGTGGLTYEGTNHERLFFEGNDITIKEPGFVYIWLSNEETNPVEVYFDDFKVTHVKSPVIETNDYYSGGAMFNTYTRENTLLNRFKYQHKEFQDDLGINLYDFHWRQYDPWGEFTTTMDPAAEKFYDWSPYSWEMGNPIKNIDHDGRVVGTIVGTIVGGVAGAIVAAVNHTDVWAGAAEGATSGFIAGAAVDITIASGGTAAPFIIAAAVAGGAAGGAAGDVVGQVVTNTRSNGGDIRKAADNVNFDKTATKALTGAATGLIGGVAGVGVGKALGAVTNSTKTVQAQMGKNIVETAKTLNGMGASAQTTQKAVDKIVNGMGAAGKNTANAVVKAEAAAVVTTESAVKVGEAVVQKKLNNQ